MCLSSVSRATGIDLFSVTLSTELQGASANQAVRFVTAAGVDAPTDSIVLSYATAFDLSALSSPNDFDFAVDDDAACDGPFTDKALAAAATLGTWGVSVGSTTVTFSPPTDAIPGEIDPNRCVQMLIGTNASVGATGVNQIVNPGTVGSYVITVAGGFGNAGATPVAITDSDAVGVSACVGGCGGSGGGGEPSDTTAPLIITLQVTDITGTSATVSWGTDEPASSTVAWGTTTSYGDGTIMDSSLVYSHSYGLTGLAEGTLYYVRVTATDATGNPATATITFTTLDETPPVITDLQVVNITETSARILWTTNEPATTELRYGTTTDYGDGTFVDTTLTTDHVVDLSGLTPGVLYHFLVTSADASGNNTSSSDQSFTTLQNLPPANATLHVASMDAENSLTWELPDETDLAGVVLVFRTDRYPNGPFDGDVLVNGMATSYDHTGLTNGVTYYYGLFVYDTSGQYSSGTLGEGTPSAIAPPGPACGNDLCEDGETSDSCPIDCPAPPPAASCGNGTCDSGETTDSCSADCPAAVPPPAEEPTPETPPVETPPAETPPSETAPPPPPAASGGTTTPTTPPTVPPTEVIPPSGTVPTPTSPEAPITLLPGIIVPAGIAAPFLALSDAASAAATSVAQAVGQANHALDVVREIPGVQPVTSAAAVTAIAVAVTQAAILAVAFDIIPFLQYLFTAPLLLFWTRKRKAFGVVYDAYTKLPIDLAIVRLYRLPDNKLVNTVVTDRQGRYVFLAQPGNYRIQVSKPNELFPSVSLKKIRDDGAFLDVYHGELIRVVSRDSVIAVNIPLDPTTAKKPATPARLRWKRFLRRLQNLAAVSGVLVSVFVFLIRPSTLTALLVAVQVAVYLLFRRLARAPKPKGWGIVYDSSTRQPLPNVVVRVFDPVYNKLLDSRLTDSKGRYFFLLGPSSFIATFEKPSFERAELRPIDFTASKGPQELRAKVALKRKKV